MTENLPNLRKEIDIQICEAQQSPNGINLKKNMQRHFIFKLSKAKEKEF